jgi:hypothetical protein
MMDDQTIWQGIICLVIFGLGYALGLRRNTVGSFKAGLHLGLHKGIKLANGTEKIDE